MTALARAIWSLFAVLVVVLGVAGAAEAGAPGVDGHFAVAADEVEAGAAEVGAGAPGPEVRDCPCPSEWSDAVCGDAACAPGLVQAAVLGPPVAGTARDGRAAGLLRGLARGPEPTPPRALG